MPDTLALRIEIDPAGPAPAYRQLAAQLRSAIHQGGLPAGTRLPPSRSLAAQLGIGRNTAVLAYAELAAEGWLDPRGRHGSFIRLPVARAPAAGRHAAPLLARRLRPDTAPAVPAAQDWRLGQAHAATLPLQAWRTACREAGRHLPPAGYGDPRGDPRLRQAIAQWMRTQRSVAADARQVVITQGAGQALELLARLLLAPGDLCAVENPGYPRAAQAFAQRGAQLLPVPVDADGLVVAQAFAGAKKPALLHLTPVHQYPLGGRLSGARRRQLLTLAQRHGTLLVENEYDHEFVHSGPNHAPLASAAPEQAILVSTFAKAFSPALRLGFVIAPPAIADALAGLIEEESRQASWPVQESVGWLLRSGELERHLRRVRRHYAALHAHIRERVGGSADSPVALNGDGAGLHVFLRTEGRASQLRLERQLARDGVLLDRLGGFELEPTAHHGVLLGYGHMSLAELDRSLARLASAVRACLG